MSQDPSLTREISEIMVQELRLKDKNEEELFSALLQAGESWTEEQRTSVETAYTLARMVHKNDVYREQPYVYHLLRVANRLTGYMHISDPELVIAALLHDSVEDRALELIDAGISYAKEILAAEASVPEDPRERQNLALEHLAVLFSPRVAKMIASVTNAPAPKDTEETYDEWLDRYARKVEQAASTPEGFLIKFADWCDNGLGLVHSEEPEDSPKLARFRQKYVRALPIFERRFQDADVLSMLDPQGQVYVAHQLALGRERLAT